MAEPYRRDIDFAFFAVYFGYSKSEYEELTPREATFIRRAWEDKRVSESTLIRNAVLNAVSNALRKKHARFRELWKKVGIPVDKEKVQDNLKTVHEIEEKEGKDWVEKIYAANGLKLRRG